MHPRLKGLLAALALVCCGAFPALALPDPCSTQRKTITPIILAAAGNVLIAPSNASQPTYTVFICAIHLTLAPSATTASSIQFIQGTGATCTANVVNLSGVEGGTASSVDPMVLNLGDGNGMVLNATLAGRNLCLVVAGATVQLGGTVESVVSP